MDRIFPVIRPLSAPPGHRDLPADRALVSRAIAGFLHELLVTDDGRLRRFVQVDQLDAWKIGADGARRVAYDELPAADGLRMRDDGIWQLASGDGYESSRLLLPGFLHAFGGKVDGEPVAVVPHARLLLVAGSENAPQIARMLQESVLAWRTEGDPVSPVPYVCRDGDIVPWTPDADDPVTRGSVHAVRVALAAREYAAQADDPKKDAAYEVGLSKDEVPQPYGFCRWTEGWSGTIPDCDVLVLEGEATVAVPLADAVRILELKATNHLPRRWAVRHWPDRATWGKLRDHAVPGDRL